MNLLQVANNGFYLPWVLSCNITESSGALFMLPVRFSLGAGELNRAGTSWSGGDGASIDV